MRAPASRGGYKKGRTLGCAQGSAHRQARYQRQPSAAFAQGPGTRAPAFAEPRHKQRGLAHAAKTSCELQAGQRRLTDGLRVRTDGQRQCRPTGRLLQSYEGTLPRECSGVGDLKVAATPSPQRHQHKAVTTPPSQRGAALRTKTLGAAAGAQ